MIAAVLFRNCLIAISRIAVVVSLIPVLAAEPAPTVSLDHVNLLGALHSQAPRLDASVLRLALRAYRCAASASDKVNAGILTVIDYSRPSTEPRLWVIDVEHRQVLFEELVSHGQGSGENLTTSFSNTPNSHQSSLGLFRTAGTYIGRNGYSLRLEGLEGGVNDKAWERAIVMHGAPYVSEAFVRTRGRLGRSWGCPAVRKEVARPLIDTIKNGSLIFSYFPDRDWLTASDFLDGEACSN